MCIHIYMYICIYTYMLPPRRIHRFSRVLSQKQLIQKTVRQTKNKCYAVRIPMMLWFMLNKVVHECFKLEKIRESWPRSPVEDFEGFPTTQTLNPNYETVRTQPKTTDPPQPQNSRTGALSSADEHVCLRRLRLKTAHTLGLTLLRKKVYSSSLYPCRKDRSRGERAWLHHLSQQTGLVSTSANCRCIGNQ